MSDSPPSTALSPVQQFAELLPKSIRSAYATIPTELQFLTEKELKKVCYPKVRQLNDGRGYEETTFDFDDRLRHSFWLEFELAISQNREMIVSNIFSRITTEVHFYKILENPKRVAWITHPPGSYTVDVETLLSRTTNRLFEIVEMPITTKVCRCHWVCKCKPKGVKRADWDEETMCACKPTCKCPEKLDTKAMELILKMRDSLELRARGSVPQVIKQTSQNVHLQLHGKASEAKQAPTPQSMEEIQRELAELKSKREALVSGTAPHKERDVIDVSPEPEVVE